MSLLARVHAPDDGYKAGMLQPALGVSSRASTYSNLLLLLRLISSLGLEA